MNCTEIKEKLIFLINGDLRAVDERKVIDHINDCGRCSLLFEKMKSTLEVLDNEKIREQNPNFVNRVLQRIEEQESAQEYSTSFPALRIMRPAAFSVLSAAAIFAGIILGGKFSVQLTYPENQRELELEAFAAEYFPDELQEENIESILYTQNTE